MGFPECPAAKIREEMIVLVKKKKRLPRYIVFLSHQCSKHTLQMVVCLFLDMCRNEALTPFQATHSVIGSLEVVRWEEHWAKSQA